MLNTLSSAHLIFRGYKLAIQIDFPDTHTHTHTHVFYTYKLLKHIFSLKMFYLCIVLKVFVILYFSNDTLNWSKATVKLKFVYFFYFKIKKYFLV